MSKIVFSMDNRQLEVEEGTTLLEAARQAGIYIPALCAHPDLRPTGDCRLCLMEVEEKGIVTSCTTPVVPGMVVHTTTEKVAELRRNLLELMLSEHPHLCLVCQRTEQCGRFDVCVRDQPRTARCLNCPKNQRCELQKAVEFIALKEMRLPYRERGLPVVTTDPFFDRDPNLCILCGRCVRMCQEVRGMGALTFQVSGTRLEVGPARGQSLEEAGCRFCGACVDACPTGALVERANKWAGLPDSTVATICPYCGVGCKLNLEVKGERLLRASPAREGAVNRGQACVRGRFGLDFVNDGDRLTSPLMIRFGQLSEVSWDEALQTIVDLLRRFKGNEVAVITSAKATNEDNYVLQKFARVALGTNHVDHCARLCHAPTLVGLGASFGAGAMTNPIEDLAKAACVFILGSNVGATQPVTALEVKRAKEKGAKIIVANPQEVDFAAAADCWLRHHPGSDMALLGGMMRVILDERFEDAKFIQERGEGYPEFAESLHAFDLDTVEKATGVPQAQIAQAARLYATSKPAALIYGMGITQHAWGTDNVLAIANLALLTGNVGQPGAGVYPLRGHNNVQGACDMGCLPDMLPGYQSVADAAARQKFEAAWGSPLPTEPGLTLTEIFKAIAQGQIKALYLVGENPVLSEPDARPVLEALKRLPLFIVQDLFLTETAQLAHIVLPSASFAEKDGTFTNTERRIQRVRQALPPPGEARPDWWIACEIAKGLGKAGFEYDHPSQILAEVASLIPAWGGVSYERLDGEGLCWPCPSPDHPGTPLLHRDGFARGRGKFHPLRQEAPRVAVSGEYPLLLTTQRSPYQFHTRTLTGKVRGLKALHGEEWVEINYQDAQALAITEGDSVRVVSPRGQVLARARVNARCPPGVVSMTFHFAESPTNMLTESTLDPASKMPALKICPVRVEKVRRAAV